MLSLNEETSIDPQFSAQETDFTNHLISYIKLNDSSKQKKPQTNMARGFRIWRSGRDSNPRPPA